MQFHTIYTQAIPKQRQVNPWPDPEAYVADFVAQLAFCWKPSRPFPATLYFSANALPGKTYCALPKRIRLDYSQELHAAEQDWWAFSNAQKRAAKPQARGRFERLIDRLVAWRQGWRKADRRLLSSGNSHPLF